mmetsp:Transcript_24740/g.39718  ORF Transcript_24740/g.39718 Transcript_24740/m.39718 type:complete len:205 (+) Transcript_24740:325-939(+)
MRRQDGDMRLSREDLQALQLNVLAESEEAVMAVWRRARLLQRAPTETPAPLKDACEQVKKVLHQQVACPRLVLRSLPATRARKCGDCVWVRLKVTILQLADYQKRFPQAPRMAATPVQNCKADAREVLPFQLAKAEEADLRAQTCRQGRADLAQKIHLAIYRRLHEIVKPFNLAPWTCSRRLVKPVEVTAAPGAATGFHWVRGD